MFIYIIQYKNTCIAKPIIIICNYKFIKKSAYFLI